MLVRPLMGSRSFDHSLLYTHPFRCAQMPAATESTKPAPAKPAAAKPAKKPAEGGAAAAKPPAKKKPAAEAGSGKPAPAAPAAAAGDKKKTDKKPATPAAAKKPTTPAADKKPTAPAADKKTPAPAPKKAVEEVTVDEPVVVVPKPPVALPVLNTLQWASCAKLLENLLNYSPSLGAALAHLRPFKSTQHLVDQLGAALDALPPSCEYPGRCAPRHPLATWPAWPQNSPSH